MEEGTEESDSEEKEKETGQDFSKFRHLSDDEANENLINFYKRLGFKSFPRDKNLMIRRENAD